jgi:circadian clock protein KaiB
MVVGSDLRRAERPRRTPVSTSATSRASKAFEKALASRPTGKYLLRLYVAGASERSRRAVLRARQLCETEIHGNFELEVIDVYQQPILARDGQIIATPTLVRESPRPVRRLFGDLTDAADLFVGLDVDSKSKTRG